VAVRVGLALAQAGEFSLVLIGTAEDRGIFASDVADISIAIGTMRPLSTLSA
jgi:Kef-type K+ transport system membrane component KefB